MAFLFSLICAFEFGGDRIVHGELVEESNIGDICVPASEILAVNRLANGRSRLSWT